MPVRTYDPKKYAVIIGGVPMSGYADGTFIKVTRSADTFTKTVGVDGNPTRSHIHDRSGEIILTFNQSSPSNAVLSAIAKVDEESNGGIVPVLIKDSLPPNGGLPSIAVSAKSWIKKWPDQELGKESSNREWTLDCEDIERFEGGNLEQ
jgi:hypothetical protein